MGKGCARDGAGRGRAQLKELERQQKRRSTRTQRDLLDLSLLDIVSFYRDVLAVQLGARVPVLNVDLEREVHALARASTPERTVQRIDSVLACRDALAANVAPLLAVEAMTLALR